MKRLHPAACENSDGTRSVAVSYVLAAAALLALSAGCHQITEFEEGGSSGVTVIRTEDFSVETVISGFDKGRAICSNGNFEFIVVTTEGHLYEIDSSIMEIEESYRIGNSAGGSYDRIMLSPESSRVYVMGPGGKIIEVNLSTNNVTDEFYTGPSPVDFCISPDGTNYIFVVDSADGKIRKVRTSDNQVTGETTLLATPSAICDYSEFLNTVLVACSDDAGYILHVNAETLYNSGFSSGAPCVDVAASPKDTLHCTVYSFGGSAGGMAQVIKGGVVPDFVEPVAIFGDPVRICTKPDGSRFYVLSYYDGGTLVSSVDRFSFEVDAQMAVEGYPMDITTHRNGEYLLVLTSE